MDNLEELRDGCPATGERSRPRPSLHVMFKSEADIQSFEPPCEDELKERWYTNGEYFFIKKDAMNTVRRLASTKGLCDDERTSVRGLEIIEKQSLKQREQRIKEAVNTVLTRQRTLTEESAGGDTTSSSDGSGKRPTDESVSQEIAREYHEVACCAEEIAIRNASLDRKEAEEYLKEDALKETEQQPQPPSPSPKKTHRKKTSAGKVFTNVFKRKPRKSS